MRARPKFRHIQRVVAITNQPSPWQQKPVVRDGVLTPPLLNGATSLQLRLASSVLSLFISINPSFPK
jgi:hypothetical protein